MKRLEIFGGLDERLIKKRFWPRFLPQIRNDYCMLEMYTFAEEKIVMDLMVFYSEEDTPFVHIEPWSKMAIGEKIFFRMEWQHFF